MLCVGLLFASCCCCVCAVEVAFQLKWDLFVLHQVLVEIQESIFIIYVCAV